MSSVHEYNQVKQDIAGSLKLNPKYIIWDDYGNNYFPLLNNFR